VDIWVKIFVLKTHKGKIYTPKLRLIILITWLIFHEKIACFSEIQAQILLLEIFVLKAHKIKIYTIKLRLIIVITGLICYENIAFFIKFKLRYMGKNIHFENLLSNNLHPKVAIDNSHHMVDFFMKKRCFL